jgi:mannose-6-phosphate isomerase-like protein (cupin superfamily)/pyrroloquinoline quinone (PQQ) biosynthesis protein C
MQQLSNQFDLEIKDNSLDEYEIHSLKQIALSHPIWNNPLLKACINKTLSKEDFKFIFSQYYCYSKNFTKLIATMLCKTESDYFRAKLAENLWEEGGGSNPDKRHAEIFRKFLRDGLGVDHAKINYEAFSENFVNQYYWLCYTAEPIECAASLAFATEGIVADLYSIFKQGLLHVGLSEAELEFFNIHIMCDDDHAKTLQEMALSYKDMPFWMERCANIIDKTLSLRDKFFTHIYQALQQYKINLLLQRISAPDNSIMDVRKNSLFNIDKIDNPLYENIEYDQKIKFRVDRIPINTDVLDPRIVHISPGYNNEMHRHAHETVLLFLSGQGQVIIDNQTIDVTANSMVHVPRWCYHQTMNTGNADLCFFAVTDYGLTKRIPSNTEHVYRAKNRGVPDERNSSLK